jgi:hypothetical protein
MSTVFPPKDEEDVLHRWEATDFSITTVLLGLAILRSSVAVVLLEHVALLEGVVDRRHVVRAGLLQHVVEHAGASRGRSRALSAPELAHEVPAGRALVEGVHDLRLGYARELRTTLGEALYEVPE